MGTRGRRPLQLLALSAVVIHAQSQTMIRAGFSTAMLFLAVTVVEAAPLVPQAYDMKGDLKIEKYDECAVEWPRFQQTHNKTYQPDEQDARLATFCTNLAKIQAHNAEAHAGRWSFSLGLNHMADMHPEEVGGLLTAKAVDHTDPAIKVPAYVPQEHERRAAATNKSVDWRGSPGLASVKNQGSCGSCWTFSAIDVINFQTNASHSNQQILDCMPKPKNMVCSGGAPVYALQWLATVGSDSYASYPYKQRFPTVQQLCKNSFPETALVPTAKVSNVKTVNTGEADLLAAATTRVVSVEIDGGTSTQFQFYKFGTFNADCGPKTGGHALAVVGYGTDRLLDSNDYWILRNNWGTFWGDGGYMYFKRGVNLCNIGTRGNVIADAVVVQPPKPFTGQWVKMENEAIQCSGGPTGEFKGNRGHTNSAQDCLNLVKDDVSLNYALRGTDGNCYACAVRTRGNEPSSWGFFGQTGSTSFARPAGV